MKTSLRQEKCLMIKFIFLKIFGWKIKGENNFTKKCIIIVAPHTHWLDFFLGITIRKVINTHAYFVAKKELFFFPLNIFLKYFGAIPVERNSNSNSVELLAEKFRNKKIFRLGLSPEGTRKKVKKWKTGFYYIAIKASVPIISVSLNVIKREINISEPFYPTNDIKKDFSYLKKFFKGTVGIVKEYS